MMSFKGTDRVNLLEVQWEEEIITLIRNISPLY